MGGKRLFFKKRITPKIFPGGGWHWRGGTLRYPWYIHVNNVYMDVSKNGGTPKSSILIRVFHYKPSILGSPYFWKHPYRDYIINHLKYISLPVVPHKAVAEVSRIGTV